MRCYLCAIGSTVGRKGVNMSELRDIIAQAENVQSKLSLAQIRSEQWKKGMAAVTSKDILEYPDIKVRSSVVYNCRKDCR